MNLVFSWNANGNLKFPFQSNTPIYSVACICIACLHYLLIDFNHQLEFVASANLLLLLFFYLLLSAFSLDFNSVAPSMWNCHFKFTKCAFHQSCTFCTFYVWQSIYFLLAFFPSVCFYFIFQYVPFSSYISNVSCPNSLMYMYSIFSLSLHRAAVWADGSLFRLHTNIWSSQLTQRQC